jgi:hypothetical protein
MLQDLIVRKDQLASIPEFAGKLFFLAKNLGMSIFKWI